MLACFPVTTHKKHFAPQYAQSVPEWEFNCFWGGDFDAGDILA